MLELAILGLLKEQPLHGYELRKRVGETLGSLWGISYGSLYPALRRLEREQAIETVEPNAGRPDPVGLTSTGSLKGDLALAQQRKSARPNRRTRKVYRITPRGEQRLHDLLVEDVAGDDEREFALQLVFCRHLDATDRLTVLERRRDALARRLSRARRGTQSRVDRYTRSLLDHRDESTRRDLEWVKQLITSETREAASGNVDSTNQGAAAS